MGLKLPKVEIIMNFLDFGFLTKKVPNSAEGYRGRLRRISLGNPRITEVPIAYTYLYIDQFQNLDLKTWMFSQFP